MSERVSEFLEACVQGRLNVLISGGTGTGKTTLLNVVSSYVPGDERIITIEDAAELRLNQPHVLRLESRPQRVITPLNSTHRAVMMAIERGKLQNLIFDNQALASHRAMAAILGVFLRLPGVKQVMAMRQVKSRFFEALIRLLNR